MCRWAQIVLLKSPFIPLWWLRALKPGPHVRTPRSRLAPQAKARLEPGQNRRLWVSDLTRDQDPCRTVAALAHSLERSGADPQPAADVPWPQHSGGRIAVHGPSLPRRAPEVRDQNSVYVFVLGRGRLAGQEADSRGRVVTWQAGGEDVSPQGIGQHQCAEHPGGVEDKSMERGVPRPGRIAEVEVGQ